MHTSVAQRAQMDLPGASDVEAAQIAKLYDSLLGEVDIRKVLHRSTVVATQITCADRATVYYLLAETDELESAHVVGNVDRVIRIPVSMRSLAGYCAITGRPFLVEDAYGDLGHIDPGLRFDRSWDEANGYRTRNVACAPISFRGELLGIAQVINCAHGRFTDDHLRALESVCRFVGYALYYARMCDELASLKQLDREKAEFMRVLVHELKSPVSAARTLASSSRIVNRDNPVVVDVMERIEKRMDQLLDLVGDILDLSRIKSGDPMGVIDVFDITKETAAATETYEPVATAKGLEFRFEIPSAAVKVRIDSKAYNLIVSNLLSNAIKYTAAGSVLLTLAAVDDFAVLTVSDTGIGIPPADIPRLFGEFFRASNARKKGIGGTGVGLAGTKSLVERFRGVMELDSEEDRGSRFIVRLPLYVE